MGQLNRFEERSFPLRRGKGEEDRCMSGYSWEMQFEFPFC